MGNNLNYMRRRMQLGAQPHKAKASGEIVSVKTNLALPLTTLRIGIEPIQDLHGQDAPYPPGGGVNKTSYDTPFVGTIGEQQTTTLFSMTLAAGTYTYSCKQSVSIPTNTRNTLGVKVGEGTMEYEYATGGNYNPTDLRHKQTFTVAEESTVTFYYWSHSPSVSATFNEWQVEVGSSFTGYKPYSNICPITGWTGCNVTRTGKNLIYPKYSGRTNNGITYTVNSDGTITTSGTATASSYAAENLSSQPDKMSLLQAGTYSLTGGISANEIVYLGGKYTDGTSFPATYDRGSGATFTLTKPAYVYPQIQVVNGTSSNRTFTIQLELGSTAHAYTPFVGSTIPISWQTEAGTVYGGEVEPVKGKVTPNRVYYKGGWTQYASGNGYKAYRMQNIPYGKGYGNTEPMSNMISEFGSFSSVSMDRNIIQPPTNSSNSAYMALREDLDPDDVEFSYLVLTPTTHDITPTEISTIKGQMNVWADCGNVLEMTYWTNI